MISASEKLLPQMYEGVLILLSSSMASLGLILPKKYCHECFDLARHAGHKYSYRVGIMGCCDCGDEKMLKSETFCAKHQPFARRDSLSSLLPEYYQIYGPIIWGSIAKKLHLQLCQLLPDDALAQNISTVQVLQTVLLLLSDIFRISPLFHHFIVQALLQAFPGHLTTHACTLGDSREATEHPCSCTVLDNVMKYVLYLCDNRQISEFLAQLFKVRHDFAVAFLKSFWQNYVYIIRLTPKCQQRFDFLDNIMRKVNIIDEDIKLNLPQYADVYFYSVELAFEQVLMNPENVDDNELTLYRGLMHDYKRFYNKNGLLTDHLIREAGLIKRFVALAAKLQYVNSIVPLSAHIMYEQKGINANITRAISYLIEMYNYTFRYYAYDDPYINMELFSLLLQTIKRDMEDPSNKSLTNTVNTPLFRMLAISLDSLVFKSAVPFVQIRGTLSDFARFPEDDLCRVLDYALKRTARGLAFIAEIEAGYWVYYGESASSLQKCVEDERRYSLLYVDITLIQLLVSILPTVSSSLFELFGADTLLFPSQPESAATGKTKDDESKSRRLADKLLFLICSALFNDVAATEIFVCAAAVHPALRDLVEYTLRKEATLVVLREEEKARMYEALSMDQLIKFLPQFLRISESKGFLSGLFEINSALRDKVGYKVSAEACNYMNLFNIPSTKGFVNAEYNIQAIKKLPHLHVDPFAERVLHPQQEVFRTELTSKLLFTAPVAAQLLRIIRKERELFHCNIIQVSALRLLYEFSRVDFPHFTEEDKKSIKEILERPAPDQENNACSVALETVIARLASRPAPSSEEKKHPGNPEEDDKKLSIKERQKLIAEEFTKRRLMFEQKNKDELKDVVDKDTSSDACLFCQESTSRADFTARPYGYLCFLTTSGIYRKAYLETSKGFVAQHPEAKIVMPKLHTTKERNCIFHNCGHVMHVACFERYAKNTPLKIYFCPLCKNPFNTLLPALVEPVPHDSALCKTIQYFLDPFNNEPMRDMSPLQSILMLFMNLFCTSLSLTDLSSLHNFLNTKQKYYKSCVDCVLSLLHPEVAEIAQRYFNESTKQQARTLPLCQQSTVICYKVFSYIFLNYAKTGKMPADIPQTLLSAVTAGLHCYIFQSGMKMYMLDQGNDVDKDSLDNEVLCAALADIYKNRRDAVNEDLVAFLRKMVFLKGVIEKWDYADHSMDRVRDVITASLSPAAAISEFFKILGITTDPVDYLRGRLENDPSFPFNGKNEKVCDIANMLSPHTEKRLSPDAAFFMCTTPLHFELISLPQNYSDLFRKYYPLCCQHCKKSEKNKCLCLVCGEIVCANASCCKFSIQREGTQSELIGELNYHTISCCGGSSVFLSLCHGTLIMQSGRLGVEIASFYANSFGEEIATYCKNSEPHLDSTEFAKYFFNHEKYQYLRDMLALGRDKYEILREVNKGSDIVRENV